MGKICIIFGNYDHAGIARVAIEIGLRVQKHYQVDLVCRRILDKVEDDLTIHPLNSATTWHYWRECAQLVNKYDIIHCHDVYALPGLVRRHGRAKIIYTEHGIVPMRYTPLKGWHGILLAYACAIYGIPRVNIATAISEYIFNELNFIYKARKVIKISNGVDIDRFVYGYDDKKFYNDYPILFKVGGLTKHKGTSVLVKAMPYILQHIPGVHLYLTGKGPEEKKIEKLIDKLNLNDYVHMLGFVPDDKITELYHKCDIYCETSYWHGFGLPTLEAMICGKPVVARNAYAMTEIVQASGAGELFEGDNPETIANAVVKVWSNYEKYAERTRSFAEQYSWEQIAKSYLELYEMFV